MTISFRALAAGLLAAMALTAGPCRAQTPAPPLSDKDRRQMEVEQRDGATQAAALAKTLKFSTDKALVDRVNRVGQRLAAVANTLQFPAGFGNNHVYPFTWTFHVVDDNQINAFSVEGGYIYIYTGLLKVTASDDELAGVLGHEITHAAHHHIPMLEHDAGKVNTAMWAAVAAAMAGGSLLHSSGQNAMAYYDPNVQREQNLYDEDASPALIALLAGGLAGQAVMSNVYGEAAERDADHGGMILMQKAGFDPVGMLTIQEKLWDLERRSPTIVEGTIYQDHPMGDERVEHARAQLAEMGITPTESEVERVGVEQDHFTSVAGAAGQREIVFDKTVCATLSDPDGKRVDALVGVLNTQLDAGLKFNNVVSVGSEVMVNNQAWLTINATDTLKQSAPTTTAIAQQVAHNLQTVLYRHSILTLAAPSGPSSESIPK
ncbi:MAG: M48 family metalloprotease [Capsulimonadaceae bacterium]